MHFRDFRLRPFLTYLISASLYPLYAYLSAESHALLKLIDALTITGLVFLIIGIILSLVYHGDFDITEYVAKRSLSKGNIKSFEAFSSDKKEGTAGKFNYPLFLGLIMIVVSAILGRYFY